MQVTGYTAYMQKDCIRCMSRDLAYYASSHGIHRVRRYELRWRARSGWVERWRMRYTTMTCFGTAGLAPGRAFAMASDCVGDTS